MKAIIFDLDNTLIDWKDEFINALKSVLDEMNYDYNEEVIINIDKAIDKNELLYEKLTKENLLENINNSCNLNLPIEFIDKLIVSQGNCIYKDDNLLKVIDYLSKKYDLYVVSNWFTKTQMLRLEKMGVLKYFKKVIGADINYYKPDKRVFDMILNNYKKEELLSIGDSLKNDVLLPISLGIDAIWKTNNESNEYRTIKNLIELMDIL